MVRAGAQIGTGHQWGFQGCSQTEREIKPWILVAKTSIAMPGDYLGQNNLPKWSYSQDWSTRIKRTPCGYKDLFSPHCFEDTISSPHMPRNHIEKGKGRRVIKSGSLSILPKRIVSIIVLDWNDPFRLNLLFSFPSTYGHLGRIISVNETWRSHTFSAHLGVV